MTCPSLLAYQVTIESSAERPHSPRDHSRAAVRESEATCACDAPDELDELPASIGTKAKRVYAVLTREDGESELAADATAATPRFP
jgi:hypothetical protein